MDNLELLQRIHWLISAHRIAAGRVENVVVVLDPADAQKLGPAVLRGLDVPYTTDKSVKQGRPELRPTGRFHLLGMVKPFNVR